MWYEYVLALYVATVLIGWYTIVSNVRCKAPDSRFILAIAWALVSILMPLSTFCAVLIPNKMIEEYDLGN